MCFNDANQLDDDIPMRRRHSRRLNSQSGGSNPDQRGRHPNRVASDAADRQGQYEPDKLQTDLYLAAEKVGGSCGSGTMVEVTRPRRSDASCSCLEAVELKSPRFG